MEAAASAKSIAGCFVVGDSGDELLRAMVHALAEAGAVVEQFDDVYSALVRLAIDEHREIRLLLVDTRTADRTDSRVFDVVRRYFPWIVAAALREDSGGQPSPAVGGLTVREAVARFGEIVHGLTIPATEGAAPAPRDRSPNQQVPPAPSADGPAGDHTMDLKLHDAVRLRMSDEGGPAPVRRPPPRVPPPPQPVDLEDEILGTNDQARITPIELEALLRPADDECEQGAA